MRLLRFATLESGQRSFYPPEKMYPFRLWAQSLIIPTFAIGCSKNYSVHSFLALKHAVRTPLELFWFKHSGLTLHWLVDLLDNTRFNDTVVDSSESTAYEDMRNIDRLFEKGPVNTHRENCIFAEIVFIEFYTWMEKSSHNNIITQEPAKLFDQLEKFIATQVTNCNRNLPQDSMYHSVYITVLALAMMKILTGKTKLNYLNREDPIIFTNTLDWVKEVRKLDTKQCFYHFKLENMTKFVFGEIMTIWVGYVYLHATRIWFFVITFIWLVLLVYS